MRIVPAIALSFLVVCAAAATAGTLAPALEHQLQSTAADRPVRVLVVMARQADLPTLDRELRAEKARTGDRHRRVLEALHQAADGSQDALLASLGADKAAGRVLGWTSHWLINGVVVTATPDAIRAIAARPDVDRVEADLVPALIEPVPSAKTPPADKSLPVGMTPGVRAIGAERVWKELGIDGTGVVVGILDTGVDGTHPALAARWRGNFAPAAECWFDGAGLGDAVPIDRHYHGTHVMGILTGFAPGDTIGVAPGALWIASNVIDSNTGSNAFDNGILASLEFMADPDGDPGTTDDVPAVVQNSWGVNEQFGGYPDCDSRWWDVMDAVEAAGVVLTWSAGNEGPGAGTIRSPADRATTALNAFSVGSVSSFAPFAVSGFSSRGPSGCGGPYAIKPEVMAPGENVLSARPGGGYQFLSGTSMAGPHVAGIVALMRASNPDVDVATIKQTLMDTAHDLGPAGEDNDYGWGMVDAYAAVTAVMAGVGTVTGVIRDGGTGLPVAGAVVHQDGTYYRTTTDDTGWYRIVLPAGDVTFTVTAFGYHDASLPLSVPDGGAVAGDLDLVLRPVATVGGKVTGPDGTVVAGATVTVADTPVAPVTTDAAGVYALELPAGTDRVYNLRARADGFGSALKTITLTGPLVADIALPPQTAEDFESGDFGSYAWQQGGDAGWTIDTGAFEGMYCARSGTVGDHGISRLSLVYDVLDTGDLAFHVRVSCEAAYDNLRFYVDGVLKQSWSGDTAWTPWVQELAPGRHTLLWSYEKDESVTAGDDAAWLDMIEFPAQATPVLPAIEVVPGSLTATLHPGGSRDLDLAVGNTGATDLTYSVSMGSLPTVLAVENPVKHLVPAKTEADARAAVSPGGDIGGPDVFGYTWRDSDHPFGPEYAWVDIRGDGTPVTLGDDENKGPFDLGFAFPFYGHSYGQIRICSNGFLSFSTTSNAWANQGIPDAQEPNSLIAPFWDDLAPDQGGQIHVRADQGRFIVQFTDVPHFGAPGVTETFEAILNADGSIVYQYAHVGSDAGCTVGIENGPGTDGLLVQFNSPASLRDGQAIRIAADPPPSWLSASPASATVMPGASGSLVVRCDAADLVIGEYQAFLSLVSNDPIHPVLAVPVTLMVTDAAGDGGTPDLPRVVAFAGAVPNPFNPATELRFTLPAEAPVSLQVYDVAGRLVRTLVAGTLPAGNHAVRWDGRDDGGRGAASGTYVARLVVDGRPSSRAMTLLR